MSLVVNTNVASINAQINLSRTTRSLEGSFARISSGLRITSAADDAAGLGVAENLDAVSISARQAMRNTNDGISIIQTAEGATSEVANMIKRLRELAVQASSETLDDTERAYVTDEAQSLIEEIDRIANTVEFNGILLGEGTNTALDVQVGVMDTTNDRIAITLGDITSANIFNAATVDLGAAADAQSAITVLDAALDSVNGFRSDYGATQNRLESALTNMETYYENLKAAESQIRDADFAYETAMLTRNQILQQAGVSILSQASAASQAALSLL